MAASTGKTGRGGRFLVGDGASPETFTAIKNATAIAFTGRSADEVDFTHLESTGGFREYRQGFKDPGSVNVDIHFDPTDSTHTNLLALFLSGDPFNFKIDYTNIGWNKAEAGVGYVSNPGDVNINPNDPVGGTVTIRVSGGTSFVDTTTP